MRRDPADGGFLGRNGTDFTAFGRCATDADGHWAVRTLPPGPTGGPDAPYISVCVFARGLLHHLFTRAYPTDEAGEETMGGGAALAADPLLASLTPRRRRTLLAVAEPHGLHRFDIRLQGEEETVFLEFR